MNRDVLNDYINNKSIVEPKDNFEQQLLQSLNQRIKKLKLRRRITYILALMSLSMLTVTLIIRYIKIDTMVIIQSLIAVIMISFVSYIHYCFKIRKLRSEILKYKNEQ